MGLAPDARVDSVLGLAMISDEIINQVDLANVSVPTLLVAAELDVNTPRPGAFASTTAFRAPRRRTSCYPMPCIARLVRAFVVKCKLRQRSLSRTRTRPAPSSMDARSPMCW